MIIHFFYKMFVISIGCLPLRFPKGNRFVQPSLRHRTGSQAEAMRQSGIVVKFRWNAQSTHSVQAALHGTPVGDAIVFAGAGKGGWIIFCVVAVAGVLPSHAAIRAPAEPPQRE